MKQQGVKAGVPDLFLPIPKGDYHGLFIEMKRKDGGQLTKAQIGWLDKLNKQGYMARCCHGADNAIALIEHYLKQ